MSLNLLDDSFRGLSLIEASAGTGKTWTLTALYARLLLERQLSVRQILVVTYTQAATAELRERIRERLSVLLALFEGKPLAEEDSFCQDLYARYAEDAAARRRILLAVHGFDEAAIFTIHGFCQRALQEAAFEAGGDFDNELTPDDRELVDAVLVDAWRTELAQAEPLWAGFLMQRQITPLWLRQRLQSHLGKPYLQVVPDAQTPWPLLPDLHPLWQQAAQCWQQDSAAWVEVLSAHEGLNKTTHKTEKFGGWQYALDSYFSDFARVFQSTEALTKFGRAALDKACKKGHSLPDSPIPDLLDQLSQALEQVQDGYQQRLAVLQSRLLEQLNRELPKRKAAQRLQAFDDLLNQLHQALEDAHKGTRLAEILREQYPLALIDEFQDTDPIQYAIFQRIYQQDTQPAVDLCFVGDPKQAIYAFRGADLDTYLQAREQIAAKHRYSLSTNYRSAPALLCALNHLFARPLAFSEQCLAYEPVSAPDKQRPQLHLPEAEGNAPLSWVWLGDEPLTKGQAEALAAEDTALRIARILSAAAKGQAGFTMEPEPKPIQGGDIAVLVANHRQAALIAKALSRHAVPSVRKGRDSVWHSEEAEDLAAVLTAYAEPAQEGWLGYALSTRLLGRSAHWLAEAQVQQSLWDKERETAERYHQLWQEHGFLRAFRLWLDEQGVAERLLAYPEGERRLTNLLHLGELLEAQQERRPGMEPLLRWFAEQRQGEGGGDDALLRLESDAERVQIVTIHTSKGLEYPLVFCPFLWDGRLLGQHQDSARCHTPEGQSLLDLGGPDLEQHLECARQERYAEQLRLIYVALTRPRERLWIHWGPVLIAKEGKLPKEGLHSSALAWLIHGRDQQQPPVLQRLAEHLQGCSAADLETELQKLISGSQDSMQLLALDQQPAQGQGEQRAAVELHLSLLNRPLYSAWRIGSFSGLAAGMHKEAPDYDAFSPLDTQDSGQGFHGFARGARAGTCLHAILEHWALGKGALHELSLEALRDHGFPEDQAELVTAHLQQVLDCPLDGEALRLSELPAERCLPELGFTFPVQHLEITRLRALLTDPAMGLPEPLRQAAAHLKFDSLQGFLKGFIDLTFEYQGRWYILDYKSNWLGPDSSYYHPDQLLQALASEHYYLQYLIYLVALRRFLRVRLPDFSNEDLGGAYYLFLRGMPEAGVYFARPTDALLDALDQLFMQGVL
ncbi:DNA helicase/exodeoxyribonuclease V beta subunit [Azomonas agilis]|uniref:RecBCD enzyme subunit RecB n=1 Tax=Azomonas agilis TaxID=116849 RepID=A0A562I1B5_9GAMM|nr:exodeoxyribonuclease V subunit beta [Azomonas agilis]TWH64616.1 DNA helicase/exodeoxyribonuclease V beta subunit [Azomonas agilis]